MIPSVLECSCLALHTAERQVQRPQLSEEASVREDPAVQFDRFNGVQKRKPLVDHEKRQNQRG